MTSGHAIQIQGSTFSLGTSITVSTGATILHYRTEKNLKSRAIGDTEEVTYYDADADGSVSVDDQIVESVVVGMETAIDISGENDTLWSTSIRRNEIDPLNIDSYKGIFAGLDAV